MRSQKKLGPGIGVNSPKLSLRPFQATKVKSGPVLFVFVADKTDQDLKALKESLQPVLAALTEVKTALQGETK